MKVDIVINKPLYRNIKIEELGIKFSKIPLKEKTFILSELDKLGFFNSEKMKKTLYEFDIINQLSKENIENFSIEKLLENTKKLQENILLHDDSSENFQMISTYSLLKEKGYDFLSREKFIKRLDSILRIEVNEQILSEYIYKEEYITFISELLSLGQLIKDSERGNFIEEFSFENLLNRGIFSDKNKEYFMYDIILYLATDDECKYEVSYSYLESLRKFFKFITKKDLKDFIYSLNILHQKNISERNELINYSSLIERILNEREEDNAKSLVLKGGIILRETIKSKSLTSNEKLKKMLNFSYTIRSCVVHGNDEKIIAEYEKFLKNSKVSIPVQYKDNDYKNRINAAIFTANSLLLLVLRVVFKYWIKHPDRINYMKIC